MMKKVLMLSFVLFTAFRSFSQTLEDVNNMLGKKDYAAAKAAIDKYMSDPAHTTTYDGWYFKGFVYNSFSRQPQVSKTDAYNYKIAAFDAFKKNQQLDRLDLMMKGEAYRSYLDLYLGFYDLGARQFNEKDFAASYNSFLKAQEIENFILAKGFSYEEVKLSKIDTSLIVNLGAAALQSKDTLKGISHYRNITDANIGGKDYEAIYEYLASYYREKNDDANLQAILAKGKNLYPQNKLWQEIELQKLSAGGDKTAMFARYEELYRNEPSNFTNTYNYSVELYNHIYKDQKDTSFATKTKLTEVLRTAIANDNTADLEGTGLLANHLYNWAADYSSAAALIKGTKPEDIKKKKALNALANAKMDEAIIPSDKMVQHYVSLPTLTGRQKVNYQQFLNYLSDIYITRANPKKAAEYDKLRDAIKY